MKKDYEKIFDARYESYDFVYYEVLHISCVLGKLLVGILVQLIQQLLKQIFEIES